MKHLLKCEVRENYVYSINFERLLKKPSKNYTAKALKVIKTFKSEPTCSIFVFKISKIFVGSCA